MRKEILSASLFCLKREPIQLMGGFYSDSAMTASANSSSNKHGGIYTKIVIGFLFLFIWRFLASNNFRNRISLLILPIGWCSCS
jgi:hypothetical protein